MPNMYFGHQCSCMLDLVNRIKFIIIFGRSSIISVYCSEHAFAYVEKQHSRSVREQKSVNVSSGQYIPGKQHHSGSRKLKRSREIK